MCILKTLAFCIVLAFAASGTLAQDRPPMTILSPEDLWHGFDPRALPLEIEVLQTWQEEGVTFEKLRFTGEVAEGGEKVRVFAIQGAPTGGKRLPGILHIHGGGQTASLAWVKFWTGRGYVCVSFDFCGPWQQRTEYTEWGPIEQGNMAKAQGGLQVHPTPRESSWYHWALVSRRALTLLESHPAVDPKRLGIFGISVGGNLTWMVAGSDRRVKAAVPCYGSGYNYDNRKKLWGFPPLTGDLALFKQTLSPEAHAPYVTCPILHLNATNDFHAWMDASYETLSAAKGPTRQAFTPRYNHHIEPEQGANLERWMDWHLRGGRPFPKTPVLAVRLGNDGVPRAVLSSDGAESVKRVDVYYTLGDKLPPARFWRSAEVSRQGGKWEATLPVVYVWDSVYAFANVLYDSGVCLTSNLKGFVPGQLGKARATLAWTPALEHGPTGLENWYYTHAYTDPNITLTYLRTGKETGIGHYLTLNPELFGEKMEFNLSTHILGDPQHQGKPGMALSFRCRGDFAESGLIVSVVENDWGPRSKTYSATVKKEELGSGWRNVVLPLSRFVSEDGKTPESWGVLDRLQIAGATTAQGPPGFAQFRWVEVGQAASK